MDKSVRNRRVTDSALIAQGNCELIYAMLVCDNNNGQIYIRDGVDTGGDILAEIRAVSRTSKALAPKEPIPFPKGIYVDVQSGTSTVFIQWRDLSSS